MTQLLTIDEAINLLQISKPTMYRLTSQKRIPFVKVGGSVRFSEARLTEWLEKLTIVPGESYGKESI